MSPDGALQLTKTLDQRTTRRSVALQQLAGGAVVIFCLATLSACRSKLDVQTAGSTTPATVAVQEAGGLAPAPGGKIYFQTRDVITVEIGKDVLAGAQKYTLLNTTQSGSDDTKAVPLITDGSLSLSDSPRFSVQPSADGGLTLAFYPGKAGWNGLFFYGVNTLKVVADDNADARFATIELTLLDFDLMETTSTFFADGKETDADATGASFEGWTPLVTTSSVAASDGSTLTTGLLDIINGQ